MVVNLRVYEIARRRQQDAEGAGAGSKTSPLCVMELPPETGGPKIATAIERQEIPKTCIGLHLR